MNIFEALRESHTQQRDLIDQLLKTSGDTTERRTLFYALKNELYAHAVAEDRYLYIPLMMNDSGLNISRHALAEHHKMDELLEKITETAWHSSRWLILARQLAETVSHHLQEEEHGFFQQAGKILADKEKDALAKQYLKEYKKYKASDDMSLT